jgi:hypothetical protein
MYHLHIQPSEIDKLEYYEYWYIVKDLADFIKKQNEGQKEQEENAYKYNDSMKSPKAPNIKQPSIKMPNIKTPKF